MTIYRSPSTLSNLLSTKSSDQVLRILYEELQRRGLEDEYKLILCDKSDENAIKYGCSIGECSWKLIYRKNQETTQYQLTDFNNKHRHANKKIIPELSTFDKTQSLVDCLIYEAEICRHLQINHNWTTKDYTKYCEYTDRQNYGSNGILILSSENRKKRKDLTIHTLKQLYDSLKNDIIFVCNPLLQSVTSIPEFTFLATRTTINIYKAKGQILFIANFHNKILETYENGEKMICTIFYGILANYQCVLFAAAVYPQKYISTSSGNLLTGLYQAISIFFSKLPLCQTLMTESDPEIVRTTKYVIDSKFSSIFHIVDPYDYAYKNFPQHLVGESLKIILSETEAEYAINKRNWYQDASYSELDKRIMTECLKKYGEKSLYLGNRPFLKGEILKTCVNITMIKLIKQKISYQSLGKFFEQFVRMTLKIDQIYEKKEPYKIYYLRATQSTNQSIIHPLKYEDKINQDPEFIQRVQYYRLNYYKSAFSILMSQLSKTGETDYLPMLRSPSDKYIQFKDSDNRIFICQYSQSKYECSCNFTKYWGIPCKHLWKLCEHLKLNIEDYICKYWKLEASYAQIKTLYWLKKGQLPPKQGQPKKSNRNKAK